MKTLLIATVLAALACGCGFDSAPECSSKDGHSYGMWTNSWKEANEIGGMRQSRTCTNCGLYQCRTSY